jgi:hypothetical protein
MPYKLIDPDERLDYACDWTAFLAEGGSPADTIVESTWLIFPQDGSPPTPSLSGAQVTGAVASVFVAGCAARETYRLTNRIATAQGRSADRSFTLLCRNR